MTQKATKLHANLDMISENPSIDTCDRWGNMFFFFFTITFFFLCNHVIYMWNENVS